VSNALLIERESALFMSVVLDVACGFSYTLQELPHVLLATLFVITVIQQF
jgi:hypothetical protein